jgi:hypothetical protein
MQCEKNIYVDLMHNSMQTLDAKFFIRNESVYIKLES